MTAHSLTNVSKYAMQSGAAGAHKYWAKAGLLLVSALIAVSGCSALPDKPVRSAMYDFGPGNLAVATPPTTSLPPIAIDDITTPGGALDNQAVLYRLPTRTRSSCAPTAWPAGRYRLHSWCANDCETP